MENNRTFEITDLSGENLENVRWHGFMTVYAIVSTTGGNRVTTEVDYERETNPKWDTPINFRLHDPSIHNNSLHLNIQFFCDRTFKSDKYIAGFSISFKRLFDEITGNIKTSRAVRYPVLNSAGQEQGFVKFSYKFGELPKPTSQQKLSLSSAQPKPPSQLPPQQRPPSQSPQPPSSQQPRPSQRPKRQPQSPEQPPPQQQLPSQSPQPPSSQQPQRPKRQPQSPEYPPPQEPRPSSQSTQQPRPRPQPQQQGPPPQPTPSSGQQQLRPQQPRPPPRPQQQQYPQQSRPPPPQQRPYPQQARPPPPRPQQRPYLQQARPPPPRSRPPPQSTQNAAAFRAQFVATGQVQVPLSENSPNPPEPALDNHIDQLNTSVEAQYGLDPDHDNSIPGDIQSEHVENEAYCQMSAPEYENNENNHNRDEYQDNEEGYGNNEDGYGYDGVDKGEDYGDGEEFIEEGYQDDGVNNGEDYGVCEENYDDEEGYEDEGNEEDCGGEEEEEEEDEYEEEDG